MHGRASALGLDKCGADRKQMHRVEMYEGVSEVTGVWQSMWKNLGVDKLLELLTETIEDGGR